MLGVGGWWRERESACSLSRLNSHCFGQWHSNPNEGLCLIYFRELYIFHLYFTSPLYFNNLLFTNPKMCNTRKLLPFVLLYLTKFSTGDIACANVHMRKQRAHAQSHKPVCAEMESVFTTSSLFCSDGCN